jgi:ABC-2 type transport system ATP-binding protein
METFVLDLEAPLGEPPDLGRQKLNMIDEQTLEAEIFRGDSLNELFAGLSSRGIRVISMRNKTNRLEELFMSLVENGSAGRRAS